MADTQRESLLARLAALDTADTDSWAAVTAQAPRHAAGFEDPALDRGTSAESQVLDRVRDLLKPGDAAAPAPDTFVPKEPSSLAEAQLTASAVEGLVLKLMLSRGDMSGRSIGDHLKLPFRLLDEELREDEGRPARRSQGLRRR